MRWHHAPSVLEVRTRCQYTPAKRPLGYTLPVMPVLDTETSLRRRMTAGASRASAAGQL